ncbi:hypothetical protein GCM10023198_42540 [Promicromonospora umidemergens]|uniref:Uncharacterized protein n=1 Tax=Promicromonospora umidemergens TaxID=629679 RepID=A0ABP8XWM5_9MICO
MGGAAPDTSPTVTDWISAIGTVGALGVAVIILAFDIYRRWAMWRRGQAQEVTAWLARPEKDPAARVVAVRCEPQWRPDL